MGVPNVAMSPLPPPLWGALGCIPHFWGGSPVSSPSLLGVLSVVPPPTIGGPQCASPLLGGPWVSPPLLGVPTPPILGSPQCVSPTTGGFLASPPLSVGGGIPSVTPHSTVGVPTVPTPHSGGPQHLCPPYGGVPNLSMCPPPLPGGPQCLCPPHGGPQGVGVLGGAEGEGIYNSGGSHPGGPQNPIIKAVAPSSGPNPCIVIVIVTPYPPKRQEPLRGGHWPSGLYCLVVTGTLQPWHLPALAR